MSFIDAEGRKLSTDEHDQLSSLISEHSTSLLLALTNAQQVMVRDRDAKPRSLDLLAKAKYSTAVRNSGLAEKDVSFLLGLVERYGEVFLHKWIEHENPVRPRTRYVLREVMVPDERYERLSRRYADAIQALTVFGIDTNEAPTLNQIVEVLTPRQLEAIEQLKKPMLVLTPPMTREQMVRAINDKKGKYGIQYDTYTYNNVADNALYSDGKPEENLTWEVSIVEGVTDVGVNEALQMKDGRFLKNYKQVAALLKDLKERGLEALSGARDYLATMMVALANGQPIDIQNWTVLNANTVAQDPNSFLGCGYWASDRVRLAYAFPYYRNASLRLRGAVRVKM